jgi:vitamin B12 transporter
MDQAAPIEANEIVVTASRAPEEAAQTPASVTIIDQARIERLGEPQIAGFLRLVPSAAVSTSGPMGSITEVRIRGAEANHTLLFIDGIRANDPAESNTPRFELLNPDIASRIEVIRGPQSALWGSGRWARRRPPVGLRRNGLVRLPARRRQHGNRPRQARCNAQRRFPALRRDQ